MKPKSVAEYIGGFPKERQKKLREMRAVLKRVVPGAKEELKWGVPVFSLHRILFAYAGFKHSLNFMPTPSAMKPFKKELAAWGTGKGSIQFPYDKPLPKGLIRRIALFRLKELKEKDIRWM